jgi:hypothetical protein
MRRVAVVALAISVVVAALAWRDVVLTFLVRYDIICFDPLSLSMPPDSIRDLVERSDLIAIGEVTGVHPGEPVYPPGLSKAETDARGWPEARLWVTPIDLDLVRVHKGHSEHDSVVYRRVGDSHEAGRCDIWPYPDVGNQYLYFLVRNAEDPSSYIVNGPCRQIILGPNGPACSDRSKIVLSFMQGMSNNDFIDAVEREIASR